MTNVNAKKNYIAHTYIFRNGALRHSEKEFGTAVAAFKYLYKKIKRYAGTTDVTHTVEAPNGKELYRNRLGYDVRFADSEIEKLYDEYEGITDTAEAEENYINDYAVSVEAQEIAISAEMELADPNREPVFVIIGQNGAKYRFYREVKIATAKHFTDGDTINAYVYGNGDGVLEALIEVPYSMHEELHTGAHKTFGTYKIGVYHNRSYGEVSKVIAELKHAIMRGDKTFKMPEDKAAEVETKKASRKVITRDDLNSFCFRLEKVSNGQFGALVEAQKKAVALLGTEIPESVYKADNSYHAFHIWLGSEINPVIVYSDGNKDEIRVCGDAYGFVAVKEETPEEKPAEVEETSDNANEIATEKSYIEQLGTQKIHHAENLVAALESFDERIESGAGIKSLENAARKIDRIIKQIEEINRNIAVHEKRIADLEKEEASDNANEKKYIGRRIHKYAVHYHLTDEDGYSESGGFFCDDLKVAFAKCTEYGKNILGKDGHAFIKTDVVIYVRYGHGGECVMVEEGANIIRELIKERDAKTVAGYNFDTELDTEIDDAIFAEVEETSDVAKFKVGKMYRAYHLYFDTPHKWNFKVVKRTATHITVCDDFDDEGEKETFRCKVCFDEHYGGEYVESKTEYDSIGCRIRADREYIPGEKEKVA